MQGFVRPIVLRKTLANKQKGSASFRIRQGPVPASNKKDFESGM